MFGNPNLSATPVDDMYSSQADISGNSFSNPVNPANMSPGWGIDPSLLSPSYTSSYRPHYSGSNGAVEGGRPGFFSGLHNLAPWSDSPNWGNPVDHSQSSVDSVASRPVDAAMWAAQRIGMPYAAFRLTNKLFGATNMMGMSKSMYGLGRTVGRGFGSGVARGMGASSGGIIARGLGSSMGGVMGAAAGWGIPLMTAQGLMTAGEKAVFNPYINTRRSSENLRDNFSGVTFGDAQGNSITGGGLGGAESSHFARSITREGINDMSLSTGEYGAAANMVGRSGLLDNVKAQGIPKAIKESITQMKLIMSIASMPEMKDAIEQLAKLQKMGANTSGGAYSDAAGTMRQLGALASVAGTNVQKMMNTVGAQGQYLYQANGLTPHLGQLAAANSYASLSSANRMGLISTEQLARMGGLEGATQASLTGQLNASQTMYNKISNFNSYLGNGRQGSTLGNLGAFGQTMARDPLHTMGAMSLYGGAMQSRQSKERGSLAVDDQVWERLKGLPGVINSKGKIDIESAAPFMKQMGMSDEEIQAYAHERMGETDPASYAQRSKAISRNLIEQQQQLIDQNNLYAGGIGRTIHDVKKFGRESTNFFADMYGSKISEVEGGLRDTVGSVKNDMWYGSTIKSSGLTMEEALNGSASPKDTSRFDIDSVKEPEYKSNLFSMDRVAERGKHLNLKDLAEELNNAKSKGNTHAIEYFNATSPKEKQAALNKFKESGGMSGRLSEYYSDPDKYKTLVKDLGSISRTTAEETPGVMSNLFSAATSILPSSNKKPDKIDKAADILERVGGIKGGDLVDNARVAGNAYEAMTSSNELTTSNIGDAMKTNENVKAFMKARGFKEDADPQDVLKALRSTSDAVASNGLVGFVGSAQKVKGNGIETAKKIGERNGNRFRDDDSIDTSHMSHEEAMMATLPMKEAARLKGDAYDKLKQGHLDYSGMQNTINAIDNKVAVKKFSDAVDKFAKAQEGTSGGDNSTNKWGTGGEGMLFRGVGRMWDSITGQDKQKVL